jgi:NADH-ubiquinone oxidoreductase chain 6
MELFHYFITLATLAAFFVINSKNAIYSVLFLILVFFNTSGLLLLVGVDFFSMVFLVVYVGAIAVLFLFVVMMLHIKINEMSEKKLKYIPLGLSVGLLFLFQIVYITEKESLPILSNFPRFQNIMEDAKFATNIQNIGYVLYTHNAIHFILASFILFVAMLGAIVLTIQKNIYIKRQSLFSQNNREMVKTVSRFSS